MDNDEKRKKYILFSIGAAAFLVIFLVSIFRFIIPLRRQAIEYGTSIGEKIGEVVGRAVGTRNGVEDSAETGYEDGKEEAMNEADVYPFIESMDTEVLQVFSASVKIPVYYEIHKDKDEEKPIQYATMKILEGEAYFSVDVGKAQVSLDGNRLTVILPALDVDLKGIKISDTEPAAEYQRYSWSGSAQDGITEFEAKTDKALADAEIKIGQDETLLKLAKASAINQVTALAKAMVGSEVVVTVTFAD